VLAGDIAHDEVVDEDAVIVPAKLAAVFPGWSGTTPRVYTTIFA
jgi:hypothetical protein